MIGDPGGHRLYTDLAPWWPLISGPQEYAEEAEMAAAILATSPSMACSYAGSICWASGWMQNVLMTAYGVGRLT